MDEVFENLANIDSYGVSDLKPGNVVLDKPFDDCWFIQNHTFWGKDQYFEVRMRSIRQELAFMGWHNLEAHSIPSWRRSTFYVAVPDWWEGLEPSRHLIVPSPPVLAYYSNMVFSGGMQSVFVWSVAQSEFRVMKDFSFVADARDKVQYWTTSDKRTSNYNGILVPLPPFFFEHVSAGFFCDILDQTGLNKARGLLAYEHAAEIDWRGIRSVDSWLPSSWATGAVLPFPAD